jgi:uncharacterized protein DUF4232
MHRSRLLSALLAAAVTPLWASASASAAPSNARSTKIGCASSQLVVWLDTEGDGAAGSVYYHLEFTNLSAHACTLGGFAGVSAVSLAARQIGAAAGRSGTSPARVVTLASGATASAVLQISQAANYPAATCRAVTAAGLRVYPPNRTSAKIVPFPFRACSRTGPVVLHVGAVTAR